MLDQTPNESQQALDKAVAAFDQAPQPGKVSSPLSSSIPTSIDSVEQEPEEDVETTEEAQEEEETEEKELSPFAEQFKDMFGIEPDEAVSLVNSLASFRDEMTLMREWAVSPVEYDQRISAVKEFYQTLPEDQREQFNNPEGAKAIWQHLEKNQPAQKAKPKRAASTFSKPQTAPKQEIIKRSEILAMDNATYKANYARITKAFAEGRVVD